MAKKYILEMKNISKSFPGVKALDNVSLQIEPGTVHALMGENGAGKSTLMKCAFGLYHPDQGEILINGERVSYTDTRDAQAKGISMIHQELHPVKSQNVMENIWISRIPYKKIAGVRWVDFKRMFQETKEILDNLGIKIDPKAMVGDLSVSHCQLIEIARAVSFGAKVIIMDEPTSSLTETESEVLFRIIRKLTAEGVAIIYISHKIEEVLELSDNITIMRDGRLVGTWLKSELDMDSIVAKMVGHEMTNRFPEKKHSPGPPLLEVKNYTSANPHSFKNISFEVRRGEIFGIGGLVGAQRTELVESIFGLRPITSGQIFINGKETKITCPQDAIRNKIALLTEERRVSGIYPMLSIVENTVMVKRSAERKIYSPNGLFLKKKKMEADTRECVERLSVKTPSLETQIQFLSGGNQQKVLFGRWILLNPDILILDEPTRGIDVGAKYEIYTLMEEMAREGKCVIMISSEMPELMGMSDRIMVMCEGHNSGILEKGEINDERIMYLASTFEEEKR